MVALLNSSLLGQAWARTEAKVTLGRTGLSAWTAMEHCYAPKTCTKLYNVYTVSNKHPFQFNTQISIYKQTLRWKLEELHNKASLWQPQNLTFTLQYPCSLLTSRPSWTPASLKFIKLQENFEPASQSPLQSSTVYLTRSSSHLFFKGSL